jgi:hypothetical protein
MKKSLFRIALEFVAITMPLTWLWMNGGQDLYFRFFMRMARPILLLLGVTNFPPGLVKDRMISFIPFFALMLVTPQIPLARRWIGIGAGFALLFVSHTALVWWSFVSFIRDGKSPESMLMYFPALVIADAMPFLLWALFANRALSAFFARILPKAPARRSANGPGQGKDAN